MYQLHKSYYRILIFIIGIIATIAYRLVVVLNHYSSFWVEVSWYIGTVGFIWYFGHRFRIEGRREKLINKLSLVDKIKAGKKLDKNDQEALVYILKGLGTSLARWNYIAIFFFSFLAIAYAIYMDLLNILK